MADNGWPKTRGDTRRCLDAVLFFARILFHADRLDTPQLVLDYMEAPWKWEPEHEIWAGCGHPSPEDPDWDWFIRKLEKEID